MFRTRCVYIAQPPLGRTFTNLFSVRQGVACYALLHRQCLRSGALTSPLTPQSPQQMPSSTTSLASLDPQMILNALGSDALAAISFFVRMQSMNGVVFLSRKTLWKEYEHNVSSKDARRFLKSLTLNTKPVTCKLLKICW